MSDLGEKFFYALLKEGKMDSFMKMGNIAPLFDHVETDQVIFEKLHTFVTAYGKLPELKTFKELIGQSLKKTKEPARFHYDKMLERHIRRGLIKAGEDANEKLKSKDVFGAMQSLQTDLGKLNMDLMGPQLYDFKFSHGLLAHELKRKKEIDYGLNLGWPTFDNMSGSLRGGDVVSFVGRPAAGKTFLLLHAAIKMWRKNKKTVLFISMEMKPIIIFERLAAMYQHIPYNWVKLGEFPTFRKDAKKQFLDKMLKLQDKDLPPLYVVDGNLTATAQDIINLVQQLKPDVVCVDGAYLVELNKNYKGDQEKVGSVCTLLKSAVAERFDIPVIPSWQLNRESTKIKKTEKPGIEHISYSDKIGQLSSIVLGLFQEDSIETLRQRDVRILKGRSGETGGFPINWNFRQMDFSEVEKISDFEVQVT